MLHRVMSQKIEHGLTAVCLSLICTLLTSQATDEMCAWLEKDCNITESAIRTLHSIILDDELVFLRILFLLSVDFFILPFSFTFYFDTSFNFVTPCYSVTCFFREERENKSSEVSSNTNRVTRPSESCITETCTSEVAENGPGNLQAMSNQ